MDLDRDTATWCRRDNSTLTELATEEQWARLRKEAHNRAHSNRPVDMNWGCTCTAFDCVRKLTESQISLASEADIVAFCKATKLLFDTPRHLHRTPTGVYVRAALLDDKEDKESLLLKYPWPNCAHQAAGPFFGPVHGGTLPFSKKLHFLFAYSKGMSHQSIGPVCSIHANTCTQWRKEVETVLAAAHLAEAEKWRGKARFIQGDEFATGTRKYGKGAEVSKLGQQWFQSVVITNGGGYVLAFFVRYVPQRTKQILQPWLLSFAADGCVVTTDGWKGYNDLQGTASTRGLMISHEVVNHNEAYVDSEGRHSNSVEGMHMHLKMFLAKFARMGNELNEVINRVYASALLHNPSSNENAYTTLFQKLLRGYQTVAVSGSDLVFEMMEERKLLERPQVENVVYHNGLQRKTFRVVGTQEVFIASPGRQLRAEDVAPAVVDNSIKKPRTELELEREAHKEKSRVMKLAVNELAFAKKRQARAEKRALKAAEEATRCLANVRKFTVKHEIASAKVALTQSVMASKGRGRPSNASRAAAATVAAATAAATTAPADDDSSASFQRARSVSSSSSSSSSSSFSSSSSSNSSYNSDYTE